MSCSYLAGWHMWLTSMMSSSTRTFQLLWSAAKLTVPAWRYCHVWMYTAQYCSTHHSTMGHILMLFWFSGWFIDRVPNLSYVLDSNILCFRLKRLWPQMTLWSQSWLRSCRTYGRELDTRRSKRRTKVTLMIQELLTDLKCAHLPPAG